MKRSAKITSGIAAFILIGGILLFANGLVGNPVSKILANRSAEKYIEETYGDMDLKIDKAMYNFKDGRYSVNIKSPKSIDTHFYIEISPTGKVEIDEYDGNVRENWNTFQRITKEYRDLVDTIFGSEDFPYESDIDFGDLKLKEKESDEPFGPIYGISLEELELDKIYDIRELGKTKGQIILCIDDEKINSERAAQVLLHIKDIFHEKNIPFYAIDFTLREPRTEENMNDGEEFQVREFLYSDIYEEDLVERLEKAAEELEEYYEIEDAKTKELINK